jgi:hypothetical protein
VVEHLPSKYEVPSSNPSIAKKKEEEQEEEEKKSSPRRAERAVKIS